MKAPDPRPAIRPPTPTKEETNIELAYALLWRSNVVDARLFQARALLLEALGGQGSPRQARAISILQSKVLR